jgi:hypothetical protein
MSRFCRRSNALAIVATALLAGAQAPVPVSAQVLAPVLAQVLAQGGVGLLAKPLDEQARPNPLGGLPQGAQNMAQNFANGGAAPGQPPAAPAADAAPTADVPFMTVKYIPAYFLTILGAGLGLFAACKFSGRRRDV